MGLVRRTATVATTRRPLTDRQREILLFFHAFTAEHGRFPTFREAIRSLGIGNTNGLLCHLETLELKGYLLRANGSHDHRGWRLAGTRLVLEYTDDDAGRRLREAVEGRAKQ